jgi:uncharacterized membrane protein YgdD (TMEM256/DUF423 family)
MPSHPKTFLTLGAISAAAAVALAAVLAHLPGRDAAVSAMLASALAQHQFHAVGLLLVGMLMLRAAPSRWLSASGWLFVAGTVLFSFNIYARGLAGFDALRALAPWGGAAFILGWLCLAAGAIGLHAKPGQ